MWVAREVHDVDAQLVCLDVREVYVLARDGKLVANRFWLAVPMRPVTSKTCFSGCRRRRVTPSAAGKVARRCRGMARSNHVTRPKRIRPRASARASGKLG
jgi:hypothetical protein